MIVVHRKTIQRILACILIGIFAFSFQIANKKTNNTVETTATPVSGKTVVVDARASEFRMKALKVVQVQQKQKLI